MIAKAAEIIALTRNRKKDGAFFPEPSECIAACEKAKRVLECERTPMLAVEKAPTGFSPERHKLALDCLGTELGIEAVKAQWHGQLYDFIYRNARMPKGSEIDDLKRRARDVEKDVEALERGEVKIQVGPGFDTRSLARLGRSVLARRDKIKVAAAAK